MSFYIYQLTDFPPSQTNRQCNKGFDFKGIQCYNWNYPIGFHSRFYSEVNSYASAFDLDYNQNVIITGVTKDNTINNGLNTAFYQYHSVNGEKWLKTFLQENLLLANSVKIQKTKNYAQKIVSVLKGNQGMMLIMLINATDGEMIKLYQDNSDQLRPLYEINQPNSIVFTDDNQFFISAFNLDKIQNVIARFDFSILGTSLNGKWSKIIGSQYPSHQFLSIYLDEVNDGLFLNFKKSFVFDSFTHNARLGIIKLNAKTGQPLWSRGFEYNKTTLESDKTFISEFSVYRLNAQEIIGICSHTQHGEDVLYNMQFSLLQIDYVSNQYSMYITELNKNQRCRDVKINSMNQFYALSNDQTEYFGHMFFYKINFNNTNNVSILEQAIIFQDYR
ncbi:UNKNOWN [Stylonychia lemnae]|uniref:Uncharacterized protein n=1 Tax=Stylonychia lemnae TaxID=5949 RepID=A0A078A0A0_STYLE|nr:UNKNOWN [Stylonychia lemnae]|eukprot:CDW74853.1 UNKNOWN [Stylonychia lemnae]